MSLTEAHIGEEEVPRHHLMAISFSCEPIFLNYVLCLTGGSPDGQLGFFLRYGGKDFEDKRPRQCFVDESKRLLGVLDRQLEGRNWMVGDYSIADIATLGWVNALVESYAAGDILSLSNYSNIQAWLGRGLSKPAVQRGLHIPARSA